MAKSFAYRVAVAVALTGIGGAITRADAQSPAVKAGDLTIADVFTREPPKGARVAGGFMTITNGGTMPDRLMSVTTAFAKRVEIHEMAMDAGVMKMRELPAGLIIEPGAKLELKPGAYHVMFMDLTQAPVAGRSVKATLRFEKAGAVDVDIAVVPMGAGNTKTQHHH